MKTIFSFFNLFILSFTLTFAPLPNIKVYAAEDGVPVAGCNNDKEQDENQVYTVGCDMTAAVQATQMSSNSGDQGMIIGIIQQAVGAMMALVLIKSILYKYVQSYRNDCSMDKTGKATLLMAQLSSLSYIMGDLISNMQFKKLSEEATKDAFLVTAKADDKNTKGEVKEEAIKYNQEQIRSFDTMIKVLEGQQKAMTTKLTLASIAEAGYIAAEVVELVGIAGTTSACTTSYTSYMSAKTTALTSLTTAGTAAAAQGTAYAASVYTSGLASFCYTLQGLVVQKSAREVARQGTKAAEAAADTAKKTGLFAKAAAFFVKEWKGLVSLVTGPINAIKGIFNKIPSTQKAEEMEALARSGANAVTNKAELSADTADLASIKSTVACAGAYAAAEAAYNADLAADQMPVLCCGKEGDSSQPESGTPGSVANAPGTLAMVVQDLKAPDIDVASFEQFDPKEIMFSIIENNLYAQAYKNIDFTTKGAIENKNELFAYLSEIDSGMKVLRKEFKNIQFDDKLFYETKSQKIFDLLAKTLRNVNFISTAQAGIVSTAISSAALKMIGEKLGGPWQEIFNYGTKYMMLNALLGKIAKEWAFVKKKNRAITWGLMTAVNAAIIIFDAKTLKKIKKNKDIVKREKEKFLKAAGGYVALGEGDVDPTDYNADNLYDYSDQPMFSGGLGDLLACVSPKAGGFIPDTCTDKRSKKPYLLPGLGFKKVDGVNYGTVNSAMGFLTDSSYRAGSGAYVNKPSLLGSDFAAASKHKNALTKVRDKLRKRIDKMEVHYAPKSKSGKKVLSPLEKIAAEFNDTFAKPIAVAPEAAKDLLADAKKKSDKKTIVASTKPVTPSVKKAATVNGDDFGLEFDDEEESVSNDIVADSAEQGEIIVEHKDIVKKPEASIFKLLSNRYLINYPSLLEEKK